MGRLELLAALQREGRETMAAITARCKAEEELLRAGHEERRVKLLLELEQQHELRCKDLQRKIIFKANHDASLIRLRAEHSLSLRLHERACIGVMQMRMDNPELLFRALISELPPDAWSSVRVNPDFVSLAARCFPDAEIIPDASLSGGFKVTSADGSLTVDNTLSTRLERLWPELLPEILAELKWSPA
jgi:vacuolar-type H+-ATPase subunit E/Vma4